MFNVPSTKSLVVVEIETMHAHMHTHKYTHTCAHIYTYMHTHIPLRWNKGGNKDYVGVEPPLSLSEFRRTDIAEEILRVNKINKLK